MEYGGPFMILVREKRGMYKEMLTLTYQNQMVENKKGKTLKTAREK